MLKSASALWLWPKASRAEGALLSPQPPQTNEANADRAAPLLTRCPLGKPRGCCSPDLARRRAGRAPARATVYIITFL